MKLPFFWEFVAWVYSMLKPEIDATSPRIDIAIVCAGEFLQKATRLVECRDRRPN